MQPVGALLHGPGASTAELGEVGGENGGRNDGFGSHLEGWDNVNGRVLIEKVQKKGRRVHKLRELGGDGGTRTYEYT